MTRLHTLFKSAIVPGLVAGLTLPALAQTDNAKPSSTPATKAQAEQSAPQKYQPVQASQVIGKNIHGADGKALGEIRDLIVDATNGDVRYAVLEFDPGLFESEKLYAVPLKELTFVADDKPLLYRNLSRQQIEKTAVGKAEWQTALDNRRYLDGLDRNYGYSRPTGEARSMRASELIGKDVDDRQGKDIGDVKDLVLDMGAGKIDYAVLAFDPSWFADEKLFAFRMDAFSPAKDDDALVLDADKAKLEAMKSFDASQWGNLNDLNRDEFVNAEPMARR